jgi:hypothetical protein
MSWQPKKHPVDDEFGEHTIDERREWWRERAAIMEYDGGIPREEAERLALVEAQQRYPV